MGGSAFCGFRACERGIGRCRRVIHAGMGSISGGYERQHILTGYAVSTETSSQRGAFAFGEADRFPTSANGRKKPACDRRGMELHGRYWPPQKGRLRCTYCTKALHLCQGVNDCAFDQGGSRGLAEATSTAAVSITRGGRNSLQGMVSIGEYRARIHGRILVVVDDILTHVIWAPRMIKAKSICARSVLEMLPLQRFCHSW